MKYNLSTGIAGMDRSLKPFFLQWKAEGVFTTDLTIPWTLGK